MSGNILYSHCSPESARLFEQVRQLWLGDAPEKDYEQLLEKTVKRLEANREWHLYFYAIYILLWNLNKYDTLRAIPHAARFLQNYQNHAAEAMAQAPEDQQYTRYRIMSSFGKIYDIYYEYPQIDEKRMEAFLALFAFACQTYGFQIRYESCRMIWAFRQRDKALAEQVLEVLTVLERAGDIGDCYACQSKYYEAGKLMIGREDEALERMFQVCSGSIPERFLKNNGSSCHSDELSQLSSLLRHALMFGDTDFIRRYLERYDALFRAAEKAFSSELDLLMCVWFGHLETKQQALDWLLETLTEDLGGPFYAIEIYLSGWIYVQFLAQAGVQAVEQTFPVHLFPGETQESYLCAELAERFRKTADAIGAELDRSRPRYDYQRLKADYASFLEGPGVRALGQKSDHKDN